MTARVIPTPARTLCHAPSAQRGMFAALVALCFSGALITPTAAQTPSVNPTALPAVQAPSGKPAVAPATGGPGWTELSPVERDILKPLAPSWNALTPRHKSKWRQMAKSYRSLTIEEQGKMQGRMQDWVALTPQQRTQARLNFATTNELSKELTPEEKKAKWQAYQALSEEEKRELAAKAPAKPVGAAATAKPVAPQKLATVPSLTDKPTSKPAAKIVDVSPSPGGLVTAPDSLPARSP